MFSHENGTRRQGKGTIRPDDRLVLLRHTRGEARAAELISLHFVPGDDTDEVTPGVNLLEQGNEHRLPRGGRRKGSQRLKSAEPAFFVDMLLEIGGLYGRANFAHDRGLVLGVAGNRQEKVLDSRAQDRHTGLMTDRHCHQNGIDALLYVLHDDLADAAVAVLH